MIKRKFAFIVILFCSLAAAQNDQTIVIRPTEIDDILVNPGMGIETFNRFSGQALNQGVKWSEVGPEKPLENAPPGSVDFPGSSVAYLRWFWSQLEPQPGKYRWEIIDNALAEAHRHNQRLAIRLMPYDDKFVQHPQNSIVGTSIRARAAQINQPTKTVKSGLPIQATLSTSKRGARSSAKWVSATMAIPI